MRDAPRPGMHSLPHGQAIGDQPHLAGDDLSFGVIFRTLRRVVGQSSQRINSVELIRLKTKNSQASRPRVNKVLQGSILDITLATLTAG